MIIKTIAFRIIIIALISFIFSGVLFYNPPKSFASYLIITGDDLGMVLSTTGPLFTDENIAPGYSNSVDISVINKGSHDISYWLSTLLTNEDRPLFDCLILEISDTQGNLRYKGVMSGLEQEQLLDTIAPGQQRIYKLSVSFPAESGNEYQGRLAQVDFVFRAMSHFDDVEPGVGVAFEHPFINNNFSLKLDSALPLKFHLVNPDGSYDKVERDVKLVINGPNAQNQPTEYVFSKEKGNLKFDDSLEQPHYIALVSTFDYSFIAGGSYTVSVEHVGTVLGTRKFIVLDKPGSNRSNSP